jgi:hypothetical protein
VRLQREMTMSKTYTLMVNGMKVNDGYTLEQARTSAKEFLEFGAESAVVLDEQGEEV